MARSKSTPRSLQGLDRADLQAGDKTGPGVNAAYSPPWDIPNDPATQYELNKPQIDPFLGTGWDRWLDAAGASAPGGMDLRASRRNAMNVQGGSFASIGTPPSLMALENLQMQGRDKAQAKPWGQG